MWQKFKDKTLLFLILITLLSFIARTTNISDVPPGLTWDEAALGYNAYSILKTGRDEYGQPFPLIFKSFGDYKPGLYVYLAIPFVAIFGLNEMSIRLPSIILGSFIPLLSFLLVKELLGKEFKLVGLLTAFFLAFSPWATHFSRGAWEANISFFLLMLGLIFLLRAQTSKKNLLVASLIFAASIYTYQSAKLFALGIFFGVVLLKRDAFLSRNYRPWVILATIVLVTALLFSILDPQVRSRLIYLNQLSYPRKEEEIQKIINEEADSKKFNYYIFHSEDLEYLKTITGRYFNYFSPKFLFAQGPADARQGVLDYGMMHFFELPFIVVGIVFLLRRSFVNRRILLLWLMISPIPAALSRDSVNTIRSLPLIFGLETLVALGAFVVWRWVNLKGKPFKLIIPGLLLFIIINISFFFDRMLTHSKIDGSVDWMNSYKEAINYVINHQSEYEEIVFTTNYNEPYIFYLFYSKYPPDRFQKQAKLLVQNPPDVGEVEKIDNLTFTYPDWHKYRFIPGLLIVGTEKELQKDEINKSNTARVLKSISFPDGKTHAFNIIETYEPKD